VANYVGSYSYWQQHFSHLSSIEQESSSAQESKEQTGNITKAVAKKLSYKLQRELDELPEKIANKEAVVTSLSDEIAAADFYDNTHDVVSTTLADLTQHQTELDTLYQRWDELENL